MKPISHLRTHSGLQAFFPTITKNVQEIEPTVAVKTATTESVANEQYRPRLLTQRTARAARRQAH